MSLKIDYTELFENFIHNHSLSFRSNYCGLVEGELGIILLMVWKYLTTRKCYYLEIAINQVNLSIDKYKDDSSLGYGLAGLAWIINLMYKNNLLDSQLGEDWLDEADKKLKKSFYTKLKNNDIDYFKGASGIFFYFLHAHGDDILINDYLLFIDKKIKKNDWATLIPLQDGSFAKTINLGVPHGLCGLILLLLQVKEETNLDVNNLIYKIAIKLLSYKTEGNAYDFAAHIWLEKKPKDNQATVLAWCYGDLSIGYAFYKAGMMINSHDLLLEGQKILDKTLHRIDCIENDFTFCHGYPSIYYIYYKLYTLSKKTQFLSASEEWMQKAKNIFETEIKNPSKLDFSFLQNASLFYGFPGFFLSLFSISNNEFSCWDKCLLL